MQCSECGSDRLVPSERRITVDRGQVYDVPMPAVECTACGRMFADEDARARLSNPAPTMPPPGTPDDET